MESLMNKDNNLISTRIPESFMKELDKWIEDKEKKNNVKLSRTIGFNLFTKVLPDLDLDIEKKRKGRRIYTINLFNGYYKK